MQEARSAATSPTGSACQGPAWADKLKASAGSDSTPVSCTVTKLTSQSGYVTVEGRKPAAVRFGGLFGIGDKNPYALASARWQFATEVVGLRPISFCLTNHHIQEWLANKNLGTPLPSPGGADHPVYPGAGLVHHMTYTKVGTDGTCGSSPGNWGWLDFNGGSNSVPELSDWLLNGYYGNGVAIGDCNGDNAVAAEPCAGDTGDKAALKAALDQLIGTTFPVVVYSTAGGTGSNSEFTVYGFLGITLRGFEINGPQGNHFMDMEFTNLEATPGTRCCTTFIPGTDLGARVIRLCAFDHDPQSQSSRCS